MLAVTVPIALAMIGWTGFSLVAGVGTGSYAFSDGLAVHGGKLAVHVSDGNVHLVPGPSARLTGSVRYSLVRPSFSADAAGVSFRCRIPTGRCSMDSTLTVPPGTSVSLSAGMGDLSVEGLSGSAASLSTDTGNISASGITASDVTVRSTAGDITLTFTRVPSHVSVSDTLGNISIVLPASGHYRVHAHSSLGGATTDVVQDPSSSHVIDVTSTIGDVSVSAG
jgi:hypothetical protein